MPKISGYKLTITKSKTFRQQSNISKHTYAKKDQVMDACRKISRLGYKVKKKLTIFSSFLSKNPFF